MRTTRQAVESRHGAQPSAGMLATMPKRLPITWREVAARQAGIVSRSQLLHLGRGDHFVDDQVAAGRWQLVSSIVVATVTGSLTREQMMWAGVLHGGPLATIGGLTALEVHGLGSWHRDDVTVLLPKSHNLEPLPGVDFVETRRDLLRFRAPGRLPLWRPAPAALLFAAYTPVTRTAYGLLAAVVQQQVATVADLGECLGQMRPLRRAKHFRRVLDDLGAGSQSLSELDLLRMCRAHGFPVPNRQTPHRDASGRLRYTDAEWRLADGRLLILEVDGPHHMSVEHWEADIERERDLVVATGAIVLRCTAQELRQGGAAVALALKRLGLGESSA